MAGIRERSFVVSDLTDCYVKNLLWSISISFKLQCLAGIPQHVLAERETLTWEKSTELGTPGAMSE